MTDASEQRLHRNAGRRSVIIGLVVAVLGAAFLIFGSARLVWVGWIPLVLGLSGAVFGALNYRRYGSG